MDKRERDLLRRIIENHLQFDDDFDPDHLEDFRTLFMTAIFKFDTVEGKKVRFISVDRYNEFAQEFSSILNELKVNIEKDGLLIKKRKKSHPDWITPLIRNEAVKADFRHHQVLGNDY